MRACNQCGKCCLKFGDGGLSASVDELEFWALFRPHIFAYTHNGNIWTDPTTGQPLSLCPWLEKVPNEQKYTCAIYHDRPEDCRHYPSRVDEMIMDECEMLEVKDLANTRKAQNDLDKLMIDSRPPVQR